MENKEKVIFCLFLFFVTFGCSQGGAEEPDAQSTERSSEVLDDRIGHIIIQNEKTLFKAPCLYVNRASKKGYYIVKNNVILFTSIVNLESDTLNIQTVVDTSTFRVVGSRKDEKEKIRNPYYFDGRMNCYYVDNINFYTYVDQKSPEFLLLGSSKNSELLGGNYVRLDAKIFSQGLQIISAHVKSYHTMEVFQEGSEWSRTIGLDKNHMYINENILNKIDFDRLIAPNDSLEKIYFSE